MYSIGLLKKSHIYGGAGGAAFDDNTAPPGPPFVGISFIKIWSGRTVNAIQVRYGMLGFDEFDANQHGE